MELIALEQHLADGEFFIKSHIYISYFYIIHVYYLLLSLTPVLRKCN